MSEEVNLVESIEDVIRESGLIAREYQGYPQDLVAHLIFLLWRDYGRKVGLDVESIAAKLGTPDRLSTVQIAQYHSDHRRINKIEIVDAMVGDWRFPSLCWEGYKTTGPAVKRDTLGMWWGPKQLWSVRSSTVTKKYLDTEAEFVLLLLGDGYLSTVKEGDYPNNPPQLLRTMDNVRQPVIDSDEVVRTAVQRGPTVPLDSGVGESGWPLFSQLHARLGQTV